MWILSVVIHSIVNGKLLQARKVGDTDGKREKGQDGGWVTKNVNVNVPKSL